MARRGKAIISCAITGSVHVPSVSRYLPITPDQIAQSAIGAAGAGAAIVHLHAREPATGRPTADPNVFAQFLPNITESCDVIVNLTTGGGQNMTLDDRMQAAQRFKPELCSLNMGSINLGLYPALERIATFKQSWEREYLEASRDWIFRNTYSDIERLVTTLGSAGTRFEFECYDMGHLYNLVHFVERGLVEPPFFVQLIFGLLGGIGPEVENLVHMKATADRLLGDDYYCSVLGAGRHQTSLVTAGAILGGSVRVGLEDSIYLAKGELAETNAAQVAKIARILSELSIDIASPADAREMLRLKGAENTAIRARL